MRGRPGNRRAHRPGHGAERLPSRSASQLRGREFIGHLHRLSPPRPSWTNDRSAIVGSFSRELFPERYGHLVEIGQGDVFVLGAGFSRAVSESMPLTDELGNACLAVHDLGADQRIPCGGFREGNFETWLSQLADEQPYFSVQENLENQALFLRFSEGIAEVLGERVQMTLAQGYPEWLAVFLGTAHRLRTTVITFNYDTLIECLVATGLLDEWGSEPLFWAELSGNVPGWPPGDVRFTATPADTFRLLKLHGSLNWYWTPGDSTGVSVARRSLPGYFRAPQPYSEEVRRRELPGRVPFVVPPSVSKSTYYRNPITREFWRQASDRLRDAHRVVVMGYSMPLTDLTFAEMFASSVGPRSGTVMVVDPNGEAVATRIKNLRVSPDRIRVVDSSDEGPIAAFVDGWVREVATTAGRSLGASGALDHPLLLMWGATVFAAVERIALTADGVALEGAPRNKFEWATHARGGDEPTLPTLRELLPHLETGCPCMVRLPDRADQFVIGHKVVHHDVGYGHGIWNVMFVAGSPPAEVTD